MRTRKKKWTAAELAENPCILRELETAARRLKAYFGDDRPIHLELGCGKGRFAARMAALYPDIRFVAVERDPVILAAAARLARELPHPPVFVCLEAEALADLFLPGDIARLYINFCDPWPNKKKWAKRRLTHGNYLALYEQLAVPEIFFKTDSRLLFEFTVESFSARGWFLRGVSADLHGALGPSPAGRDPAPETVMTEYEEKFVSRGAPIYRLEARRTY